MLTNMLIILLSTLIISMFAGWFFGTWQTRLRIKKNIDKKWNENCTYVRYWNPWNRPSHYMFTLVELERPSERAKNNPEDRKIPF